MDAVNELALVRAGRARGKHGSLTGVLFKVVDKTHQRVVLRAVLQVGLGGYNAACRFPAEVSPLQAILFQRSLGPVQSHIEDVLGCQVVRQVVGL